jgi:hypothetical protein
MANLDAMFGLPRPLGGAKASCTITLMELQDAVITVTADVVPVLPGAAETVTELTLNATANGKPFSESVCVAAYPDSAMLLFQLCSSPSDAFINNVLRPFVQGICDSQGRPLARLVKPT